MTRAIGWTLYACLAIYLLIGVLTSAISLATSLLGFGVVILVGVIYCSSQYHPDDPDDPGP